MTNYPIRSRRRPGYGKALTLWLLFAGASLFATDHPAAATTTAAASVDAQAFPREFKEADLRFWLHPPQFETLAGNRVTGRAAVSVQIGERKGADGKVEPVLTYGVVWFEARVEIDKTSREATLSGIVVKRVSFPTQAAQEARYQAGIQKAAAGMTRLVSLDQLEAAVALGQARVTEASVAVDNTPPAIVFAFEPAIMVHVDGKPVLRAMKVPGVQRIVNTRSLLLQAGNVYYLRVGGRWLTATSLSGRWVIAGAVPANVTQALAEATERKLADPMDKPSDDIVAVLKAGKAPAIMVRSDAAELIPVSGEPQFAPIAGTTLAYVVNTPADVFVVANTSWYVLVSGRWFTAPSAKGPWTYVAPDKLPADFARIPADSAKGAVLASVAGTPEAREALIANSIPQTATINRKEARFNATYDGAPDFVLISGTSLTYARNAAVPVIRVDASHYYAVSNGIWFVASSPKGPWTAATSVAPAIYTIPATSPLHYLTYVQVYGANGDSVHVGYTPGYYGTVSTRTVVVYGTGYRCTPWVGSVWYGCPGTYGTGAYFGYARTVGWTFGFGWGAYPYYGPWWGAYWPGYYNAAYWGAGAYPVAGAWNVYGQWGNAVVSGTAAAWANPWTGNYGRAVEGGYYNQRTGGRGVGQAAVNTNAYTGTTTAAARGVRYNPQTGNVVASEGVAAYNPYTGQAGAANHREVYNTNTGRQTSMAGAAGAGPEGAGAVGGFSTTGSGGTTVSGVGGVAYDRDSGTVSGGGAVKAGDNVYAGHDGNVYQKTDSGWEQVERSGNRNGAADSSQRPSGATAGALDREQAARNRGFDGSGSQRPVRGGSGERFSGGNRPSMTRGTGIVPRSGGAPKGGGRRPRG
ncbi:hypothetical protein L7H23_11315 [Sphingopyxis sp. BSN-002]|uniref:hypothetical protein n=1 Tax=Sphingopyxis sp. BSN-002 TaxID=2911495 RepID=UPI001ED9F141|nr:hypothetical protein [Sphingopyxis sp. BSN-002]UKK83157.1 hypothetical protein L7H23_11315 [Sphingopyxis sp. BSN-002]